MPTLLARARLPAPPGLQGSDLFATERALPVVASMGRYADLARNHPRVPHWYLPVLGTAPEYQGRGVGSALLRALLARSDAEGLPAYLESS